MSTRRTGTGNSPKSGSKKSLGNLLREEVQKESTPAEVSPPEALTVPTPDSVASADPIPANPAPTDPAPTDPVPPLNTATSEDLLELDRLRHELAQIQAAYHTLATDKTALEQQVQDLSQTLGTETALRQTAETQVGQLQRDIADLQGELQTLTTQGNAAQPLALLPRSSFSSAIQLPRAFSRPIVDRPVPWDIPRRPLVIAATGSPTPSELSDEEIGWFD